MFSQVPGTRATNSTPSCQSPSSCAEPLCNDIEACPHGRKLDLKGCPTCECRDPCAEAKCRDDETCELVPLDCEARIAFFSLTVASCATNLTTSCKSMLRFGSCCEFFNPIEHKMYNLRDKSKTRPALKPCPSNILAPFSRSRK